MQASSTERLGCDATATARNVSRTASGVDAPLASAFFALSVQARPKLPRAAMKSGDCDLKRGTRTFNFLWSRNLVQGRF